MTRPRVSASGGERMWRFQRICVHSAHAAQAAAGDAEIARITMYVASDSPAVIGSLLRYVLNNPARGVIDALLRNHLRAGGERLEVARACGRAHAKARMLG